MSVLSNSESASLKTATFSYDKISKYGTITGDRSSDNGVVLRTSWGLWSSSWFILLRCPHICIYTVCPESKYTDFPMDELAT